MSRRFQAISEQKNPAADGIEPLSQTQSRVSECDQGFVEDQMHQSCERLQSLSDSPSGIGLGIASLLASSALVAIVLGGVQSRAWCAGLTPNCGL